MKCKTDGRNSTGQVEEDPDPVVEVVFAADMNIEEQWTASVVVMDIPIIILRP